jgi:hypothetical protein
MDPSPVWVSPCWGRRTGYRFASGSGLGAAPLRETDRVRVPAAVPSLVGPAPVATHSAVAMTPSRSLCASAGRRSAPVHRLDTESTTDVLPWPWLCEVTATPANREAGSATVEDEPAIGVHVTPSGEVDAVKVFPDRVTAR